MSDSPSPETRSADASPPLAKRPALLAVVVSVAVLLLAAGVMLRSERGPALTVSLAGAADRDSAAPAAQPDRDPFAPGDAEDAEPVDENGDDAGDEEGLNDNGFPPVTNGNGDLEPLQPDFGDDGGEPDFGPIEPVIDDHGDNGSAAPANPVPTKPRRPTREELEALYDGPPEFADPDDSSVASLELIGIMRLRDRHQAVAVFRDGQRRVQARRGEQVQGLTVALIEARSVVLSDGRSNFTLRLKQTNGFGGTSGQQAPEQPADDAPAPEIPPEEIEAPSLPDTPSPMGSAASDGRRLHSLLVSRYDDEPTA